MRRIGINDKREIVGSFEVLHAGSLFPSMYRYTVNGDALAAHLWSGSDLGGLDSVAVKAPTWMETPADARHAQLVDLLRTLGPPARPRTSLHGQRLLPAARHVRFTDHMYNGNLIACALDAAISDVNASQEDIVFAWHRGTMLMLRTAMIFVAIERMSGDPSKFDPILNLPTITP